MNGFLIAVNKYWFLFQVGNNAELSALSPELCTLLK